MSLSLETTWEELKRIVDAKGLTVQWVEETDRYHIALVDGPFAVYTTLAKADAAVFEASYKALGNKRVITTSPALPDPDNFRFRGDTTPWTICPPGDTNIDYSVTEERHIDGGTIVVKDANPGDYCTFQIVHPVAGVVEQFVNKWFVIPGTGMMQVDVYRARVPAGLKIRVIYHNSGNTNTECGINLRLHTRQTV